MSEWVAGDHITLVKNEHYYMADQGQPFLDSVRFVFVDSSSQAMAQLLSGQCDIGTQEAIGMREAASLIEAEESGMLVAHFQENTVFEHIDFGILPEEEYAATRADWFKTPEVRQGIVMCTDRQAMVDDIFFGRSEVVHAYVPSDHPLYPDGVTEWPYDVAAANDLLDEAGYIDADEDGLREDPRLGGPFKVILYSALANEMADRVASAFAEDLAQCGVEVELQFLDNDVYFADGPDGPLFGRQFDLGAFPWLISNQPNCALYLSSQIPGPENDWDRNYNNQTGFSNESFDEACNSALASLPGMPTYEMGHKEALEVWSEQVPVIPLFMRLKVAAARPEIQIFGLDATQPSELWNLYEIDVNRKMD